MLPMGESSGSLSGTDRAEVIRQGSDEHEQRAQVIATLGSHPLYRRYLFPMTLSWLVFAFPVEGLVGSRDEVAERIL